MSEYRYVTIECENNIAKSSHLTNHRETIEAQAKEGYEYVGYIPTKFWANGKLCTLDLIFRK
ncbi:MAG: DUF4177 domain-containing protein [Lachnospiraceae bacterium]|jgi:hypothetical protein|nr:DUF4177 domain-containing protein [Lachnospiraceae bacterium]